MLEATLANLRETFRHLSETQLSEIAACLSDRRGHMFLIGGRFTDPLARYLVAHLRVLRARVRHVDGGEMNRSDQLLDVGRRDTIVLFDIRRYSGDLAAFAGKAARRGATIALFTDQWLSPISRVARHVLPARVTVPSVWDSSAALLLLVEAILAGIAAELGPAARKRLAAVEAMRNEAGKPREL
jgi:DNA-binding MurR/RpiR family transcriptional regulator